VAIHGLRHTLSSRGTPLSGPCWRREVPLDTSPRALLTAKKPPSSVALTGDQKVTYEWEVLDDDAVFKALADATRRGLLDRLFEQDGLTLSELEEGLEMTRFGVMKHLRILEQANLITTRRSGRNKHHYLNAVPIRLIHDRWIDKYTERQVSALTDLKAELERAAEQDSNAQLEKTA